MKMSQYILALAFVFSSLLVSPLFNKHDSNHAQLTASNAPDMREHIVLAANN
jgi:hypothetical protein